MGAVDLSQSKMFNELDENRLNIFLSV
jgi:hypothetical protein